MEKQKTYEMAMKKAKELERLDEYEKLTGLIRMTCCKHLQLLALPDVEEQGFTEYYNEGNILLSSSEDFGDRKNKRESSESFDERTRKRMSGLYKCSLTGGYCVSRYEGEHCSDIPSGDSNETKVSLDIQMRCPAFEFRKGLLGKLNGGESK